MQTSWYLFEEHGALCSGEKNGPAAAGEKSERPEKNRGANTREVGQTVLSLEREAPEQNNHAGTTVKMGLEAPRKKQAVQLKGKTGHTG